MVATTTAADAGAQLVGDLRAILDHAETGTLDELRGLADEITALLRRTRGRITRLARKAKAEPEAKPAAPAAHPVKVELEPVRPEQATPTPKPTPVAVSIVARLEPNADRSATGAWAIPAADRPPAVTIVFPARAASPPASLPSTPPRPSPHAGLRGRAARTLRRAGDAIRHAITRPERPAPASPLEPGAGYMHYDDDPPPRPSEWVRLRGRLFVWLLTGLVTIGIVVVLDQIPPLVWDLRFK